MTEEHRKSARRRALKSGLIVFNGGHQTISCTIRDISEHGARLQLDSVLGIPSAFTLRFGDGSPSRDCLVKWKKSTALGVEFKTDK